MLALDDDGPPRVVAVECGRSRWPHASTRDSRTGSRAACVGAYAVFERLAGPALPGLFGGGRGPCVVPWNRWT